MPGAHVGIFGYIQNLPQRMAMKTYSRKYISKHLAPWLAGHFYVWLVHVGVTRVFAGSDRNDPYTLESLWNLKMNPGKGDSY